MIEVHSQGTILVLSFNRPPVHALNTNLLRRLSNELAEIDANECSGVVVCGSPGIFSAGLDLPELMSLSRSEMQGALEVFLDTIHALAACPVSTVAAITGHSPAGGAVLSLCCDRRIMARGDWRIGLNEVEVGIPMPRTVAALASWVLGARTAARVCCESLLMSPEEALSCGFVDQLEEGDQVVSAALGWCEGLGRLSEVALRRSRARMRAELVSSIRQNRAEDLEELLEAWFDPKVRDALNAAVARIRGGGGKPA